MAGNARMGGVRWREVCWFLGLAVALCVALVLIMLFAFGREGAAQLSLVTMLTPAIAALLVVWRRPDRARGVGAVARITSMWPLRPGGRMVGWCLIGLFLLAGLAVVNVLFAAAIDLTELDLRNFSMLRAAIAESGGQVAADGSGLPALLPFLFWLVMQLGRPFALLVLAYGEELGWRGYLQPALAPLGVGRMMLVTGTAWVVWHLPLFMLTDYPGVGGLAGYFVVFSLTTVGPQTIVVTWLRLVSRSVWPAVLMHAGANTAFTVTTIMSQAGSSVNPMFSIAGHDVQLISVPMLVLGGLLLVTGQLRARPDDPAVRASTPSTRKLPALATPAVR